ncbi:transcription factor A, mitochondrial [Chanos chanos]|uniref:Transcription factor A, mitochondrial n=1 Tax=Chanos chanos TaxID=29144 RepID=A0A6J2V8H0_CHACN|nr:transcription factor A, mitochondrial [Chanos chanos]
MAPFSLISVSASLFIKSFGLFSNASAARCSCAVPVIKNFSTTAGGPPKRPLTAYIRYVKEQQPIISRQNPDIKIVEVMRKIAQQWRVMTPDQKRPFEEASLADREQYKRAMERFQAQLSPAQSAALAEEKRQKMAKRRAIRKKRELNSLGKPKRPRNAFNIFMSEHFEEAKGSTMQAKMKSLMEDWKGLYVSQKQIYIQLAEDDKVRYKNEMKSWEEHMREIGREDVIRRKEKKPRKTVTAAKGARKKSKVVKIKTSAQKTAAKKKATASSAKKTVTRTKKA